MDHPPVVDRPSDAMDATRWEILRHAEELFGHYGLKKTTMADIAERTGMSPGNLYRYFRNKHAIAIAVLEQFFRQAEAEMAAALIGVEDPEARIRAVVASGTRLMVREMARNPKLMEIVEFLIEEDEAYAKLREHIAWKRARVEQALEDGMAAGVFRRAPVYPTAVNLLTATKAFLMPQSLAAWREPETILPELDGVFDLVFAGIRARPPSE